MKYLFLFIFFFSASHLIFGQEEVKIKEIVVSDYNKYDHSLDIEFQLDIGNEYSIDKEFYINRSNKPIFYTEYSDLKNACPLEIKISSKGKNSIICKIFGFNQATMTRFLNQNSNQPIDLKVKDSIRAQILSESSPTKIVYVKAQIINDLLKEKDVFSDKQRSESLKNMDTEFYYENKADFGVRPGTDSTKTDFVLSIKLQNAYKLKRNNCNQIKNPIYWSIDTRLSTNFKDSLNYIKFYPINYSFEKFGEKLPRQLIIKLGNESSQDFTRKRVASDVSLNVITPNLVNFMTPESNRLRLKPIVSLGLKGYYDYSNDIKGFASGMAYLNGYYYIPVLNNYAFIIEGSAFYDFSKENNPNKKIQGNYSVTIGAEIPKTGFTAMFKYTSGKSDINFREGAIISIGLLMDFFQTQTERTATSN